MPGGDRTGPVGMGPMTGRKSGHCAGITRVPWFGNREFSMGPGSRRGFRRMFCVTSRWAPAYTGSREDMVKNLEREEQFLEEQLQKVRKELKDTQKEVE